MGTEVTVAMTPAELHARAEAALALRDTAREALAAAESAALLAVLDAASGNQIAAAPLLGISVATLKRHLVAAGYDAAQSQARWPIGDRYRTEIQ